MVPGTVVWIRGEYRGSTARLSYGPDGGSFTDSGAEITLKFGSWKGARMALFCYGAGGGSADFDDFRFRHGDEPVPIKLP
jgi:xylan 1,4-beta-xylosidase